ncbi:MAG: M48 family metallopeptidase [Rubrivivax sp.]|nr:M48 family metallopeptidase [Rubrivivax sp.]
MTESSDPPLSYGCGCTLHGRRRFTVLLAAGALAPVAVSAQGQPQAPECRRSRVAGLVPAGQVEGSAQQQYVQMLRQAQGQGALVPATHPQMQRLRYIAQRIVPFTRGCNDRAAQWRWEVNLLNSKQINAFCMPGGKIAFYTGILQQLQLDDDEVAMIMGHEVAHALLEHARERMAKSGGTELLFRGAAAIFGLGSLGDMAAVGATQLLSLKFGREDESEADALGLLLASQAGYNPGAGVTLWRKMGAATGGKAPPQWLSTHPAGETRIKDIQGKLPRVQPLFQAAGKPDRRFQPPAA